MKLITDSECADVRGGLTLPEPYHYAGTDRGRLEAFLRELGRAGQARARRRD